MGMIVPFSKIEIFIEELSAREQHIRSVLDTNILIAASYEIKDEYEEIMDFLKKLDLLEVKRYATVTTKAEFLDFHRRLSLTEALIDLSDGRSGFKLSKAVLAEIKKAHASVKSKQARDGSDPIFNDAQIKRIKSEFSAGHHSGHLGWLKLCEKFLKGYLRQIDRQLTDRGVIYLSPNDPTQTDLFTQTPEWSAAAALIEKTGLSVSDAMILNLLNSSVCQFAVSLDFDLGFAVRSDAASKDVVMPNSLEREYRHYHFEK